MSDLREGQRRTPLGEPMRRVAQDDEHRGMWEGLCYSCQRRDAEWEHAGEPGAWRECDDCADVDGEEALNEAKRALNRARAALTKPLTPIARELMERAVQSLECQVATLRRLAAEAEATQ